MNMTLLAATPGVYYAFQNSDTVGKAIVLILLVGSILAWTLMIEKCLHLRQAKRQNARFLEVFKARNKNWFLPDLSAKV
jgi:biopolymer transport protein ExbB/TolQ